MIFDPQPPAAARSEQDELFLPDFCRVQIVFAIIVIAELLAIVLALAPPVNQGGRWANLGLISLFIQWVALSSAALLCVSRRWLVKFSNGVAGTLAYLLILGVTCVLSEVAYGVGEYAGINIAAGTPWHGRFFFHNLAISAIASAVTLRYFYLRHHSIKSIEAQSQAQINALQARIRPHFLFNSMNTIASLTRSDPRLAEQVVEDLADLFRVTFTDTFNLVPLRDEIELCKRYLDIEMLRLGKRLRVDWGERRFPEDALIPVLTLQPLLENAVFHGIEPLAQGGTITVASERRGRLVAISICNPVEQDRDNVVQRGHNIALKNVSQRLAAHYGKSGRLEIERLEGRFEVRVIFPYTTHREPSQEP